MPRRLMAATKATTAKESRFSTEKHPFDLTRFMDEAIFGIAETGPLDPALIDGKLLLPPEWRYMSDGRPTPDVVQAIRVSRMGH